MKKLLILFLTSFMFFSIQAQEDGKKVKLTRQEKKELKKQEENKKIQLTAEIVEAKQFVLEANFINNRKKQPVSVNSRINFIKIDKDIAIFQFGSSDLAGANGIGGQTIEGKITNFDIRKNEKSGSYYIRTYISSTSGFFDINFIVTSIGNTTAEITGLSINKLGYTGKIVPIHLSSIYKGSPN